MPAHAESANVPSLIVSQIKITSSNDQFVTLYNTTDTTLDMSRYQLEYFNSYDLTKATSSRLVALSGTVPPHGYYMVNDSALLLCYAVTVDSVSLGFSSTAGMVEVLGFSQNTAGGPVAPLLQDYVAWSKTAATGAQTIPTNTNAFLLRQPLDASGNPAITTAGAGSWQTVQPDASNACQLVSAAMPNLTVTTGMGSLLPPIEPPAAIIALDSETAAPVTTIPVSDIGLRSPIVTELLPNPMGAGTDDSDEFIELYNSNDKLFDLSGFQLQVGTTAVHTYVFPTGTSMTPLSFKAVMSDESGLSLSNSGGQVKLLDPAGGSIAVSDIYGTAKDGQAWALANGKWYWTVTPTPGQTNSIKQPPAAQKTSKASSAASKKSAAGKSTASKQTKSPSGSPISFAQEQAERTPVQSRVLAVIAVLALLYGAYEYRADIGNRFYQLRRYLKDRWPHRQSATGE
jgi:hypothetical protein